MVNQKMTEICLENVGNKKDSLFSPCLRKKGHEGEHLHEELCNAIGCMCYSLKNRMSSEDAYRLEKIIELKRLLSQEEHLVQKKYFIKEEK